MVVSDDESVCVCVCQRKTQSCREKGKWVCVLVCAGVRVIVCLSV